MKISFFKSIVSITMVVIFMSYNVGSGESRNSPDAASESWVASIILALNLVHLAELALPWAKLNLNKFLTLDIETLRIEKHKFHQNMTAC